MTTTFVTLDAKHISSTVPLAATIAQHTLLAAAGIEIDMPVSGDFLAKVKADNAVAKAKRHEFYRTACKKCGGTGTYQGATYTGVCYGCGGDGRNHRLV